MGLQIRVLRASNSSEINTAFDTFVHQRTDALFVSSDPFFNSRRVQFANLASRHTMTAIFPFRDYVEAGGLMIYESDIADAWRQVGACWATFGSDRRGR